MSALLPLAPFEREPMQRAERTDSRDDGAFAHEMKKAQPKKPEQQKAQRKDDDDSDQDPPPPEAKAERAQIDPQAPAGKPQLAIVGAKAAAEAPQQVAQQQLAAAITDGAVARTASAAEALTPLEQAVHELISQLQAGREDEAPNAKTETVPEPVAVAPAPLAIADDRDPAAPAPAAPVREPAPEPPVAQNPSHVHLVIDEAERLVVTVAVRGDNVVAHIRGGDDATAAALARNAATLDHAMRARGLQLADFQAHRDDTQPERDRPQRERDAKQQPKFTLEDPQ